MRRTADAVQQRGADLEDVGKVGLCEQSLRHILTLRERGPKLCPSEPAQKGICERPRRGVWRSSQQALAILVVNTKQAIADPLIVSGA
jgi:hypothetical protein